MRGNLNLPNFVNALGDTILVYEDQKDIVPWLLSLPLNMEAFSDGTSLQNKRFRTIFDRDYCLVI